MSSADDRRRRIRIPLQKTIRHSRYQVLGTPVFEENSAIDISSGGISFEASTNYEKGTLVLLEVEIEGERVKLLVCVAWVKFIPDQVDRFQFGSELIAIDPEHKKTMQSHLGKLLRTMIDQKAKKKKTLTKKKRVKKKPVAKKPAKKKPVKKKKTSQK